jgi:hypothetical protein
MRFPLSLSDIALWLAATAIILLLTSELLSVTAEAIANVAIDKERLRLVALGSAVAFIIAAIMSISQSTA